MNYGYNNSLISYGIVSCGHKQADKSVDMMETLVKYGADINKTVAVKNPEISDGIDGIYLLFSNGSYVDDDSGHSMITDSPLAVAVHTYNPAAVKYLLEKGVDANEGIAVVLDNIYETENDIKEEIKQIREARWSSDCKRYRKLKETKEIYIQILDMLLANLKNKEISAETASAIYLYQNYYLRDDKDVVAKLKKLEVKPDYNSATMKAAMSDYKTNFDKVVRDLVEHGTDINSVDEWGNTALHSATDEGYAEAVEFLLEHGADVNKQSEYGSTALMEILRWNSWEKDAKNRIKIVKMLLKYGADTNIQTESGRTALHMAMANQDGYEEEITELLLEHGAKVNIRDKDGVTPLFEACESSKSYGIVKSLLKHGAEVNVKDKKGKTPLFYAYSLNNIKSLLNYGADVNARDTAGKTALFGILRKFAEFEQRKKVINLFVEKGYDINARDNEDHTLLMEMLYNFSNSDGYLSGNEDRKTAGYLAELGVDVNAQDKSGKTALFYAVAINNPQSVALLLELGADSSIADNEGKKAFDYCKDSICSLSPYNSDKFRAETVAKFNQEQSKYQTLWDDESINSENEELMQLSEVLTAAIDGGNCEVLKLM
jgi:ankyrin repeat protein